MNGPSATNLQTLIDNDVIDGDLVEHFTQQQLDAIEALYPGQVQTLIDVADKVGREQAVQLWLI